MAKTALIVGAGSGMSASFARLLAKDGYRVTLASRDPAKLTRLAAETNATMHPCFWR
jgi:short-subunit dehydrogenase